MFGKKYYFLAGLPRSGNTLLSSILNQNPKINVSANSYLSTILYDTLNIRSNLAFYNFPDIKSVEDCASSFFKSYYKSWKGKIIIDRSPWGTTANLKILEKFCPNEPKFICPIRRIDEILCSFIIQYNKNGLLDITNKAEVEEYCYDMMQESGVIYRGIQSVNNLSKKEYKNKVVFISYDDLCNNPQKEVDRLYDFLSIGRYKHRYENVTEYEMNGIKYNDNFDPFYKDLHKLKSNIEKTRHNVEEILPRSIIKQFGDIDFNIINTSIKT